MINNKLGLMGGSFDPIHMAHIHIAEAAYEQFGLEKIILIPAGDPPHKSHLTAGKTDRLNMVKEAAAPYAFMEVDDYEINKESTSYTYLTLEHYREVYKDYSLYFILGEDSICEFETWKNPERIFQLATILVAPRFCDKLEELKKEISYFQKKYNANIEIINLDKIAISSRVIRKEIEEGSLPLENLPPNVADYIIENRLYVK